MLILAVGLSTWSIYLSKKMRPFSSGDNTKPDAFMENVVATMINKEGAQSLIIQSPRITHYPKDDATIIESPRLTIFRDSLEPWYIDAMHAKATEGAAKIVFWDDVTIHHPHDKNIPITTFKTSTLTVFPKEKIASTKDDITLTQPETTIHATGMTANLNSGEIKLLSQTRGEYAKAQ